LELLLQCLKVLIHLLRTDHIPFAEGVQLRVGNECEKKGERGREKGLS